MAKEKIKSLVEIVAICGRLGAEGKRLVFTNGCFDLLHVGHTRYLQQARALGDALLVAVNGDVSVRALKGPTRPVNAEDDRAEVLAALESVSFVTIFQAERVTELVTAIRPHIYAKGGDYTVASLDAGERGALEEVGAEIHILPIVPGKSTTATLARAGGG
jgi:rfaE bifunctional protein nucleotidyltransferase chain/domain